MTEKTKSIKKLDYLKVISHFISFLFHPMLMPIYGTFLLFNSGMYLSFMPLSVKKIVYLLIFLSTFVIPVSTFPLLYQFKIIKNFKMETARERIWPILITAFFGYIGLFIMKKMGLSGLLGYFIRAIVFSQLFAAVISYFWKISLHTIAVGGISGTILALAFRFNLDLTIMFMILVFMSGLVGSARLYLNSHKPLQIFAGYLLGFFILFFTVILR